MKVGDRVRARLMHREIGEKNQPIWSVISKEGVVEKDFLLTVGNQALYRVAMDDGSFENIWRNQLEHVAP
jgi:hypothetical protein